MDYANARRVMVDSQVRCNDVTDLAIQHALETTPREKFLPSGLKDQAYVERELPYAAGRALITARDFAKLLAGLKPRKSDLTLNVGCGCGYEAAVLAALTEMVVAVDADETLANSASEVWAGLGIDNVAALSGDPAAGSAKQGPFDLIFICMAVERVPETLLAQLKDGGRLGALVRRKGVSKGVLFQRAGDAWSERELFDGSAMRILPGFEAPKAFVF
jgi:protein-L-isoaspartate(D-aspartate) O-methyltransferase